MNDHDETAFTNQNSRNLYHYFYDTWNDYLNSSYGLFVKEVYLICANSVTNFNVTFMNFNEFQLKILRLILTVLIINITLVIVLWNVYKDRIYERFIQSGITPVFCICA